MAKNFVAGDALITDMKKLTLRKSNLARWHKIILTLDTGSRVEL